MKLEVQEQENAKRVTIVPGEEDGIFVICGDAWVGRLHANRAVGRIGVLGLGDETIQKLETGELEISELFQQDARTGSLALSTEQPNGLIAQIDPDARVVGGTWRSIVSFREFQPVGVE